MNKIEIQNKIKELNKQISELKTNKTKYQNMTTGLNNAIPILTKADEHIENALTAFNKNYTGQVANEKTKEFQNIHTEITQIIKQLKENMLPNAKGQINTIDYKILNKRTEIQELEKKLNNI